MEFRKRMLKMIKGPRGIDFLKCFEDMSLRDASKICQINFSSLRYIKHNRAGSKWGFHELRSGRQPASRWEEIRIFREGMLKDNDFKEFKDVLLNAAKHVQMYSNGSLRTNKATEAFKEGARESAEAQKTVILPAIHQSPQMQAYHNTAQALQGQRVWTLFPSLNEQQAQVARLNLLAQEAMNIFRELPPPSWSTVPVPQAPPKKPPAVQIVRLPPPAVQIVRLPPPAVQIVRMPPPAAQIVKVPLPDPPKKEYSDAGTQSTATMILMDIMDTTVEWKPTTPRDISEPTNVHYKPFPMGRVSRGVQLRPWMLAADLMFSTIPKTLTAHDIKQALSSYYRSMMTPLYVYSDLDDFLTTRWRLVQYGMESVLVPDPELDALPELEPITDWGWLLTMGLAAHEGPDPVRRSGGSCGPTGSSL